MSLVLKNGFIADGSGSAPFRADVRIDGDRIAMVGNVADADGARVIDASGLVVCPGFIDAHAHSELAILRLPQAESSLRMGATTHIVGHCGASAGPRRDDRPMLLMDGISEQKGVLDLDWHTLGEHLSRVERSGTAINLASFVGHGSVRDVVMGEDCCRRATDSELTQMRRLVEQAMREGALGLSTGLNFAPGKLADPHEVVELCRTAGEYGGIYSTHVRTQGDKYAEAIAEALRIGREANLPVHLAHQGAFAPNLGKSLEFLQAVTDARERGQDVTIDIIAGVEGLGSLNDMLPPWTADGGFEAQLARLRDPGSRAQIRRELLGSEDWPRNNPALLARAGRWDLFGIQECRDEELVGRTFAEAARMRGQDPFDLLFDYLAGEGAPRLTLEVALAQEDVEAMSRLPYQVFSSDVWPVADDPFFGPAYPTQYGAFPWIFRRLVRERNVLSLEEAVHKLTSMPALRFGLWDRGRIREGMCADVVVFDPATIADRGTWQSPREYPVGIEYVIVNGAVVVDRGAPTGAINGRVLRRRTLPAAHPQL